MGHPWLIFGVMPVTNNIGQKMEKSIVLTIYCQDIQLSFEFHNHLFVNRRKGEEAWKRI